MELSSRTQSCSAKGRGLPIHGARLARSGRVTCKSSGRRSGPASAAREAREEIAHLETLLLTSGGILGLAGPAFADEVSPRDLGIESSRTESLTGRIPSLSLAFHPNSGAGRGHGSREGGRGGRARGGRGQPHPQVRPPLRPPHPLLPLRPVQKHRPKGEDLRLCVLHARSRRRGKPRLDHLLQDEVLLIPIQIGRVGRPLPK